MYITPTIVQWNLNGFRARFEDLQNLIKNHKPTFLLLQETNLNPQDPCTIKHYIVYRKDRVQSHRASGGVAIAIHESIDSNPIILNSNLECIAIESFFLSPIRLCSLYLSPSHPISIRDLEELFSQLPDKFILGGDFNANHPAWGSLHPNPRGTLIHNLTDNSSFCIMNSGNPTHISFSSGTLSCIDLTLCSPCLLPSLTWTTLEDPNGSDHFPILIQSIIETSSPSKPSSTGDLPSFCFSRADWSLYASSFGPLQFVENYFEG